MPVCWSLLQTWKASSYGQDVQGKGGCTGRLGRHQTRGLKVMDHLISSSHRRGSPLLIGVRSKYKLSTEQIPVLYRTCEFPEDISSQLQGSHPLAASSVWRQPYRHPPPTLCLGPSCCVAPGFKDAHAMDGDSAPSFKKAFHCEYFETCTEIEGAAGENGNCALIRASSGCFRLPRSLPPQPLKCSFSTTELFGELLRDLAGTAIAKNCRFLPHNIQKRKMGSLPRGMHIKQPAETRNPFFCLLGNIENVKNICKTRMKRLDSSTCLHAVGDKAVEFFFASDAR